MSAGEQIPLFDAQGNGIDADTFEAFLNSGFSRPVEVTFTRNRVSMVSVQFRPLGKTRLRVHEAFLTAPLEVRIALRQYLRSRRRDAWKIVAAYARDIPHGGDAAHAPSVAKPGRMRTRGHVYDLKTLCDEVNASFFSGNVSCQIGWGRDRPLQRRARRSESIRYGSCNPATAVIRIIPRLDDVRVPAEFVRYIVFHEMLHLVVPAERQGNRRLDHPPAFRKLERQFPDFERMKALASELLDVLV